MSIAPKINLVTGGNHYNLYIQCPPLILAPLVNMRTGGFENKSALFILFIFPKTMQPIIEVKQYKVGGNLTVK